MDELEARSRCRVCGWFFSGPVWDEDPIMKICKDMGYALRKVRRLNSEGQVLAGLF